jgi:SNF2 family DNA or RNA helicase
MILARIEPVSRSLFGVVSPYSKRFVQLAKEVPGMRWDGRAWVGYADAVTILTSRLELEKVAKVTGKNRLPQSVDSLSDKITVIDGHLRGYQKKGASFLIQRSVEGALLADVMGLGKTRQVLAALTQLPKPAVVVCPAKVKHVWVDDSIKLGLPEPLILNSRKPPKDAGLTKADGIVAINYEIVPYWLDVLKSAKTVVFDEAQALMNEKSRQSKSCKQLALGCSHRIALSGTPMMNRIHELWNVIDVISPGRFGKFWGFGKRHCEGHQKEIEKRDGEKMKVWDWSGKSHVEELNQRLKHFMLRRTKEDVASELPPKTRQLVQLELLEYTNADRWWSISNKSETQIALGLAAELKVPHTVQLALDCRENGSDVIVFCYQKAVARKLKQEFAKKGVDAFLATGDESIERRLKNAQLAKESHGILIATIDAMGTGIDKLSYADVLIFAELHYVPGKLLQAEDRAHRIGQLRPVNIYYLIGIGTIDELIRDRVLTKLMAFEEAVGSVGESIRRDLIGESEEQALAAIVAMAREMEAECA